MMPVSTDVLFNAVVLILLTLIMFMVTLFASRLSRHEEKTATALQELSSIRATVMATLERGERIEDKLDAHLQSHHK